MPDGIAASRAIMHLMHHIDGHYCSYNSDFNGVESSASLLASEGLYQQILGIGQKVAGSHDLNHPGQSLDILKKTSELGTDAAALVELASAIYDGANLSEYNPRFPTELRLPPARKSAVKR